MRHLVYLTQSIQKPQTTVCRCSLFIVHHPFILRLHPVLSRISISPPTDEFSSQGDERDYQSAITGAVVPVGDGGASPPADSGGGSASSDQLAVSPSPVESNLAPAIGRCKVQYDYTANMYDELTIKAGEWWSRDGEGRAGELRV